MVTLADDAATTPGFAANRPAFEAELEAWYGREAVPADGLEAELHALSAAHPEWLPAEAKAAGYQLIAERCPIKVFRHFPFFSELDVGKPRTDLGSGGVGGWYRREPFGCELASAAASWWRPFHEHGLTIAWPVLDDNHHAVGYDLVCRDGLLGRIALAEARLAQPCTPRERAFLTAAIAGNRALIALAGRFAAEARRLAAAETDPGLRRQLERLAATAGRVPAHPPATFYEALCTVLFLRETVQSVDGNGISVFGHLDRLLGPYYRADVAAGRLTRTEAADLIRYFLAFTDARFGMQYIRSSHVGTNTTVVIGGCDAAGEPVFNEVTRLIAEAYLEERFVDPKLNARVASGHDPAYLELLGRLAVSGLNNLAVFNDDVVIPANVRMGKRLEDCRLYVGGGCQENVLENTEINSRATIYLNLAQVLLMGLFPEPAAWFTQRTGVTPADLRDATAFEELYDGFLGNLGAVVGALVAQRNRTESEGWRYHPCPLHSAMIDDCLARALDMMAGGARYSFGSVSLTGAGTVIDSLFAIRRAVFEEQRLTLPGLAAALAADFAGTEPLREYLRHGIPKFGHRDDAIRAFSGRVLADLARVSSGLPNSRGGRYEASLFSFRSFTSQGKLTGATPDGRRAGEYLSPGMSPSPLALGRECSLGDLLDALQPLDLTRYPVVAVLDAFLPGTGRPLDAAVIVPVIRRFLANGGSVLQLNHADPAVLLAAREHPDRYPDLVVRISGYSAYFRTLPDAVQREIIDRTLAAPG